MSTVLRPVGPLQPRVYWLRRGVLIGLILVVIIVVAESCSGGSAKPSAHKTPPPTTPTTTSSPSTSAQVSACDPTDLKLVLSTDSDTYTSGQAPKLIGVFSNTSSATCTLSVSPSQETWTVKSGSDTIWSNKGCSSSDLAKTLRIKAGATKLVSTFWDGYRIGAGCAKGAVAQAGEYTLSATLDGVRGKTAIFHITA